MKEVSKNIMAETNEHNGMPGKSYSLELVRPSAEEWSALTEDSLSTCDDAGLIDDPDHYLWGV